ncbi:MAG: Lar family restriction alleviation protein [Dehalococcoidia bacterium]
MLYLKACPRCRGDVKLALDMYGKYLECLQCGYTIDSKEEAAKAASESKTAAA